MSRLYIQPILALIILSPFLTEVFTGSTPILTFISPITFILFITVGYGFPVLIIREIYIRKKLSFFGLFLLGLAYGLLNEGLYSRTLFHPFEVPIISFATYGLIENIRVPFMLFICSFHALYAVIYPVFITHYLFPRQAEKPWLSLKTTWILGISTIGFAILGFFYNQFNSTFSDIPGAFFGRIDHFIIVLILASLLFLIAFSFKKENLLVCTFTHYPSKKKLLVWGMVLFITFVFIPTVLGNMQISLIIFFSYYGILFGWILHKNKILSHLTLSSGALFSLMGEIMLALFGVLIAFFVMKDLFHTIFLALCVVLLTYTFIKISKRPTI